MTRSYRSIGDVLTLLREEFPDITISKIRFLESQGLVSPQRSPSGYRKFYDEDVERLRYVLVQQREHFLPLKVIRDRLNGIESDEDNGAGDPVPEVIQTTESDAASVPATPEATKGVDEAAAAGEERTPSSHAEPIREPTIADVLAALQESPRAPAPTKPERPAPAPAASGTSASARRPAAGGATTMTVDELCAETGLDESEITSLVSFGIVRPTQVAGLTCFDQHAVEIARLATGFLAVGIEPRHLKLFRNAVDREMSLVEQVVTPLLRQRNPESRARAETTAAELTDLGRDLRAAMIAGDLEGFLGR